MEKQKPLKQLLIQYTSYMYAGTFVGKITNLLQNIILARLLGPHGYGLLLYVVMVIVFYVEFVSIRVEESIIKYFAYYRSARDVPRMQSILVISYLVNIVLGVSAFSLIFFSAPYVTKYVYNLSPDESSVVLHLIRLYSFVLFIKIANGTSKCILRVFDRFKFLGIYRSLKGIGDLLFPIAFFVLGYGLKGIIFGFFLTAAITTVLIHVATIRELRSQFDRFMPAALMPEVRLMVSFWFHTYVSGIFKSLNMHIHPFILAHFTSPAEVAFYKIALSYVSFLGQLADPVPYVTYPTLAKLWAEKNITMYKAVVRKILKYMFLLSVPVAVGMLLFAGPVLRVTVKEVFLPAIPACTILIWAVVAANVTIWYRPVFLSIGRPAISTAGNLIVFAFLIALSLILVPRFGYLGTALAYTTSHLIGRAVMLYLIERHVSLFGRASTPS